MSERRNLLTISFNKGLDKRSLPFEGDPSRSSDSLNYVYRDGAVRKRHGFLPLVDSNIGKVNGIWSFKDSFGKKHIISHIGLCLVELLGLDTDEPYAEMLDSPYNGQFEDYKSTAIIGDNKLYWLGGNSHFMVLEYFADGSHSLTELSESKDVYIPTTTIGITDEESNVSQRSSLDDVNLVSQWRWNEIVGRFEDKVDGSDFVYELDSPVVLKKENDVESMRLSLKASNQSSSVVANNSIDSLGIQPIYNSDGTVTMRYVGENLTGFGYIEVIWVKDAEADSYDMTVSNVGGLPYFVGDGTNSVLKAKVIIHLGNTQESNQFTETETIEATYDKDSNKWVYDEKSGSLHTSYQNGILRFEFSSVTYRRGISESLPALDFSSIFTNKTKIDEGLADFDCFISGYDIPISNSDIVGLHSVDKTKGSIPKGSLVFYKVVEKADVAVVDLLKGNDNGYSFALGGITNSDDVSTEYYVFSKPDGGTFGFIGIRIVGYIPNWHYFYDEFDKNDNGKLHLLNNFKPNSIGSESGRVKFPVYVEGNYEKIANCHIAILFGNANAKNRLFVSGNPSIPNCDWHSTMINEDADLNSDIKDNGNFTYFGDNDYCFYGQTDNEVKGYDIISTDKMVVFKSESEVEPSYYFRVSSVGQAVTPSGESVQGMYEEQFRLSTGNKGIGAMNINSVANLNGDTLVLTSDNKICGLDVDGIVGDSKRVMNSRSAYIDDELSKLDLSDAWVWSDGRFFALVCGDLAYVTNSDTLSSDTMQYEWFKIEAEGISTFSKVNGEIFFGRKDGTICKIDDKSFHDTELIRLPFGNSINVDFGTNAFAYSNYVKSKLKSTEDGYYRYKINENKNPTKNLYRKVAVISSAEGDGVDFVLANTQEHVGRIRFVGETKESLNRISEEIGYEAKVMLNFEGSDKEFEITYAKEESDGLEDYYYITSEGEELDIGNLQTSYPLSVLKRLDGWFDVVGIDDERQEFSLRRNGKDVIVERWKSQSSTPSIDAVMRHDEPVKSFILCNPTPLGSLAYRKTIWSWTITCANGRNSLEFCKVTNDEDLSNMKNLNFNQGNKGLSLDNLSFDSVDFEKDVLPRKFTYARPVSVPFIAFAFKSEDDMESTLTSITITYTLPIEGFGRN